MPRFKVKYEILVTMKGVWDVKNEEEAQKLWDKGEYPDYSQELYADDRSAKLLEIKEILK